VKRQGGQTVWKPENSSRPHGRLEGFPLSRRLSVDMEAYRMSGRETDPQRGGGPAQKKTAGNGPSLARRNHSSYCQEGGVFLKRKRDAQCREGPRLGARRCRCYLRYHGKTPLVKKREGPDRRQVGTLGRIDGTNDTLSTTR